MHKRLYNKICASACVTDLGTELARLTALQMVMATVLVQSVSSHYAR